jgi:hypothetical protein
MVSVEIELPKWLYEAVVEAEHPEVLTMHPDYFLIEPGIGRFIYRIARLAAGKDCAKWSFRTLYERSDSTGTFKEYTRHLRKTITANDLPEYTLQEETRQSGPHLIMTHRNSLVLPAPEGGGV